TVEAEAARGELARLAAGEVEQVQLRRAVAGGDEGDVRAVGREAGLLILARPGADLACGAAAVAGHEPERGAGAVVVGIGGRDRDDDAAAVAAHVEAGDAAEARHVVEAERVRRGGRRCMRDCGDEGGVGEQYAGSHGRASYTWRR